jgi:hypothetical protein
LEQIGCGYLGFGWLANDDRILVAEYEAARMPCAAADLWRRLEHYREREMSKVL